MKVRTPVAVRAPVRSAAPEDRAADLPCCIPRSSPGQHWTPLAGRGVLEGAFGHDISRTPVNKPRGTPELRARPAAPPAAPIQARWKGKLLGGLGGATVGAGLGAALGSVVPGLGSLVGGLVGGGLGLLVGGAFGRRHDRRADLRAANAGPDLLPPLVARPPGAERSAALLEVPESLKGIHSHMEAYNASASNFMSTGEERQRHLLNVSNTALQWLAEDNHQSPHRDRVLDLINATQARYREEIGQVLEGQETFHSANDSAAKLWDKIAGGEQKGSQLRVDARDPAKPSARNAEVPDFRRNMLAELGRLVQTESGRKFLEKVAEGPAVTRIVPFTKASKDNLSRPRSEPAITLPGSRFPVPGDDLKALKNLASQNLPKSNNPKKVVPQGDPSLKTIPLGTDALVALDPGLRDSDLSVENSLTQSLPAPVFLALHHELNHAKRITRGRYDLERFPEGSEDARAWGMVEEKSAIKTSHSSENKERLARNLGERARHMDGARPRPQRWYHKFLPRFLR